MKKKNPKQNNKKQKKYPTRYIERGGNLGRKLWFQGRKHREKRYAMETFIGSDI